MRLIWSRFLNYFYLAGQEWRNTWFDIWHDPSGRWLTIVDFLSLAISWILAGWLASMTSKGLLILHYNIHFGIDLIGSPTSIYWLPAGLTLAAIINSFVLLFRYPLAKQLRITILVGSLAVFILADLALLGLLLINFR